MGRVRQVRPDARIEADLVRSAGVRRQMDTIGRAVFADMQADCPVDTGRLRESGYCELDARSRVRIGYRAAYAGFVVYGTRYMSGNPWFSNALFKPRRGDLA